MENSRTIRLQNGEYERRKSEDLEMLFNKLNIRLFLKAKRIEWPARSRLASCQKSYIERLNQISPNTATKRNTWPEMVRQGEEGYFR